MTVDTNLLDQLRSHPFLKGMRDEHLSIITGCASQARCEAGTFLFRESEPAGEIYLVRSGRVVLETYSPGRGGIQVDSIGEGDVVGWSWLMLPHRWHFDARAVEPTRLLVLHADCLLSACDQQHELGYNLFKRFMPVFQRRIESLSMQLLDVYGAHGGGAT